MHVAVITRPGSIPGQRNAGWWSYPVPYFTFDHYPTPKGVTLARERFKAYDLVFWEDGKTLVHWVGVGPPIAYLVGDSTLSDDHYQRRLEMAKQADLILVDMDRLERFGGLGASVRRFTYCVNDTRFRDYGEGKSVDVAYHMSEDDAHRVILANDLEGICRERGWVMKRGVILGEEYARSLARARIVVNISRNPETRNHRLFDAMGSGACVLAERPPAIDGEVLVYVEMEGDLREQLAWLLAGEWKTYAERGLACVRQHHTWAVRAQQLRSILAEVWPWLA